MAFAYPYAGPCLDDAVACGVLVVAVPVDLADQVVLGLVDHSYAVVAHLVHPVVVVALAVRVVVAHHAVVVHVTLAVHYLVHHHCPAAVVHADLVDLARVAVVAHVALHHVVQVALHRVVDVVVVRVESRVVVHVA